mmetsp:Transcript_38029/g.75397  ORF Transcript_38029/g.75397 Transcript_38029/m.75397 type:complete len:235 (-) Transcript_38029:96-800(-)
MTHQQQKQKQQQQLSNACVVGPWCLGAEEATAKALSAKKSCVVGNGENYTGSADANLSRVTTPVSTKESSMQAHVCISLEVSDGASGSAECQAEPASAKSGQHLKRTASWSHTNVPYLSESRLCKPMERSLTPKRLRREQLFNLEASLANCTNELEELQMKYEGGGADDMKPLFVRALDLSWRLVDLSAEALECSCSRNVPGSMDVYEQTGAAMDSIAVLLCSLASLGVDQEED